MKITEFVREDLIVPELAARDKAGVIEEMVRIDSPVQTLPRTSTRDVELHCMTIPAGSRVQLVWGAANLDDDPWETWRSGGERVTPGRPGGRGRVPAAPRSPCHPTIVTTGVRPARGVAARGRRTVDGPEGASVS